MNFVAPVCVSVVLGLLITHFFMPTSISPFTDTQIKTYQNGVLFNVFWEKASQKEKEVFIKISQEKDKAAQ